MPPHIVIFFDNLGTPKAIEMNGILTQDATSKYWRLKDGATTMPFPHTMLLLNGLDIDVEIRCVAAKHIPQNWCDQITIYEDSNGNAKIHLFKHKTNVHSIELSGHIAKTTTNSWEMWGNHGATQRLPIGVAFRAVDSRMVDILIENNQNPTSILQCSRTVVY
jgi:hypothetical protein